jgi:hypothetical protein
MTNVQSISPMRELSELRDDPLLAAIQTILLSRDRERMQALERRAEQWQGQIQSQADALHAQQSELVNDLLTLRLAIQTNETRLRDVLLALELAHRQNQSEQRAIRAELQAWQSEIAQLLAEKQKQDEQLHDMLLKAVLLSLDLHNDAERLRDQLRPIVAELLNLQLRSTSAELVETLRPLIVAAMRAQTRESQGELAEILAPVVSEALQTQSRTSHQTLVDTFSPMVGELVQQAIRDWLNDVRRALYPRATHSMPSNATQAPSRALLPVANGAQSIATPTDAIAPTNTSTSSVRRARLWVVSSVVTLLAMLLCMCFYARFTWALYPIAFATETPTPTATYTLTPTNVPTLTPTPVPLTPTPTQPPQPVAGLAKGHVWMRAAPNWSMPLTIVLPLAKPVTVLSAYGEWVEVEWFNTAGMQRGWVPVTWITLSQSVPPSRITPPPSPTRR